MCRRPAPKPLGSLLTAIVGRSDPLRLALEAALFFTDAYRIMNVVLIDTDVISFLFKQDTRAELYALICTKRFP